MQKKCLFCEFCSFLFRKCIPRPSLFDTDGDLQVDDISAKNRYGRKYKEIYTNQVNEASSRFFFSIFSENCGKGMSIVF